MSDIEPIHQQNSEIPVIVDKEEFTIDLQNYYSAHNENSKKLEWTNQRIQTVINLLEEYKTIKSQGGRVTNKHYHHAKKYDIMNIGNQKVLIMKKKDISDPVVQIIPTEEYYQKILDAHIATGHGRRDKTVHALKDKYVVPIFAVLIFINLCKTCLSKKNFPKKVVKPLISDDFNSRGQMDLVDFMCENERNIEQERTQSNINNLKRVADKMISPSSKKFKVISTGSTVSVEVLNVDMGPLNSKNLIGKVFIKKNELYQVGTDYGIDEDGMPQNAVLSSPNELLSDNPKLEHDMENYMKYKIMGSVKMVRLKPHCIPSRFSWNKKHKSTSNESHIAEAKSPIISKSKDSVQDHTEEDNAKVSSSSCIENSQIAVDVFLPVIQVQEVPSPKHKANQASQKAKYRSKELQIDVKHKDEVTSPIKFTVSTATSTLNTSMEIDQDDSPYKVLHEVMIKPDPDAPEQEEENKLGSEDIDRSSSPMLDEKLDFNDIVPILRDMSSCLQTIANKYDDSFDSFSKFVATTLRNMPQQNSEELQRQILNLLVTHLNKNKPTNVAGEKS